MRRFYADIILKNTFYDVAKMIDNKADHKLVIKHLKDKIRYCEKKNKWYKVVWWDETVPKRDYHKKNSEVKEFELFEEPKDTFRCKECDKLTEENDRSLFTDKDLCKDCKPSF